MEQKRNSRRLRLTDDLPEHHVKRLAKHQARRAEEILSAPEFPAPNDPDLQYTDKPGDFKHPAASKARPVSKSRLRGAQLPE
jgi:hypothetical protein